MEAETTLPPRRRGRTRALLSLGLLLGVTQVGTLASWTDSSTVTTGTFSTGTLDVLVGAGSADQLGGQGGAWTHTELALTGAMPGESIARTVTVGNGGTVPLTLTGTASTADDALSTEDGNGLLLTFVAGGTPDNSGSQSGGDRLGTCSGGDSVLADVPLTTDGADLSLDDYRLDAGEQTSFCVSLGLSPDAPNSLQGAATTAVLTFGGQQ